MPIREKVDPPVEVVGPVPEGNREGPPKEEPRIPTREEHRRLMRRIWFWSIMVATMVFLGMASGVLLLVAKKVDAAKIIVVSTVAFQIIACSYIAGFFIPGFISSLVKMGIAVEMSRLGLEIGQKSAKTLERLDGSVEERLAKADAVMTKMEKLADALEAGKHPVLDRLEKAFDRMTNRVVSSIDGAKKKADGEFADALAEGEREAAAITQGDGSDAVAISPGTEAAGCTACGIIHYVNDLDETGLCQDCRTIKEKCYRCGKTARARFQDDQSPVCVPCGAREGRLAIIQDRSCRKCAGVLVVSGNGEEVCYGECQK